MKFYGIICEFNPFHNGHEHLINQIKSRGDGDIVCLMSGNFVQRGEPAIEEKYLRAQKACTAGADMIVELPCIYACSNAENFAFGAIKTLKAFGITHLVFGVENTNIKVLEKIAEMKVKNSQEFQNSFRNEIENGICYNTALKRAIASQFEDSEKMLEILNKPNNILACEYLTAIKKLKANIIPVAIERCDNGFESKENKDKFLSATAIRELILKNQNVNMFLPSFAKVLNPFNHNQSEIFEKIVILNIRNKSPKELAKFYDYSEGIEYRIKEMADKYSSLDEIISNTITPRFKVSRVKKLLLYPTLNITKNLVKLSKTTNPAAKLLVIKKDKKYLLALAKKSRLNLIVTNKDYELLNKNQKSIINVDLSASNLYNLIISNENNKDKKIGVIFK